MVQILLFGRWSTEGVTVNDVSLAPYINLEPKYVPHTHGLYASKRFGRQKVFIVERLINKLMRSGQGSGKVAGRFIRGRGATGKKLNAMKVVEKAFEIIEERTGKNPIQVLVDAVINAGPRETVVRVQMGGVIIPVAVDVSPLKRLDIALKNIALGAFYKSFNNPKPLYEVLAEEIMLAANNDPQSFAVSRKEEIERIAKASR